MNADALWRHHELHNLWALWRARWAEAAFLAAVCCALLAFALWLADPLWIRLSALAARWAPALSATVGLLAPMAFLTGVARRERHELARRMRSDWLAAMPIAGSDRSTHARRVILQAHALRSALGLLIWTWLAWRFPQLPDWWLAALMGLLCSLAPVVWITQQPPSTATVTVQHSAAPVSRIPVGTTGLPILGAALEPMWIRLPRSAWAVGLGFLLLPMGSGIWLILGVALGFTAFGASTDLVAHWRARYLADAAWTAALPLTPRALFRAYLPELRSRVLRLGLMLLLAAHACGAPLLISMLLALTGPMLIAHAVLAGYATRRDPQRYPLWLPSHYVILLAATQVFPPLLPALWLGICAWLWRRGSR